MERVIRHFNYFLVLRQKHCTETPFTRTKKSARPAKFLAPCLVYPGGSLGTPKILSSGAILHLEPNYTSKIGSAVPDFLARVNNEV